MNSPRVRRKPVTPLPAVLVLLMSMVSIPDASFGQSDARAVEDTLIIPEPDPADVESIDAIVTSVYDVISGPADQERDWDRFLSLFVPEARLIPTAQTPDGSWTMRAMTPREYAERAAVFFRQPGGFFEREIGRKTEIFGTIAHVLSAYESLRSGEEQPFLRGVNSFQLVKLEDRWAVVTIFWQQETADFVIPDNLLFEKAPAADAQ